MWQKMSVLDPVSAKAFNYKEKSNYFEVHPLLAIRSKYHNEDEVCPALHKGGV